MTSIDEIRKEVERHNGKRRIVRQYISFNVLEWLRILLDTLDEKEKAPNRIADLVDHSCWTDEYIAAFMDYISDIARLNPCWEERQYKKARGVLPNNDELAEDAIRRQREVREKES